MPSNSRFLAGCVLVLATSGLQAQQPNAIREVIRSLRNDPVIRSLSFPDTGTVKCGTPSILAIHANWNRLAPQSRAGLAKIVQVRPSLQKDRVSPSGRFRIHYDTTGINQPALIAAGQDV